MILLHYTAQSARHYVTYELYTIQAKQPISIKSRRKST